MLKIRPLYDSKENFASIPVEERLALNDQMCPTKTRHHYIHYTPLYITDGNSCQRSHTSMATIFLNGKSDYAYNFDVYTVGSYRMPHELDLGSDSNAVPSLIISTKINR